MNEEPTELRLYNPSFKDFTYEWLDESDSPHLLTLRSMEITTLPITQAKFMAKHLIDYLIISEGIKDNWDADRIMWEKKVFV